MSRPGLVQSSAVSSGVLASGRLLLGSLLAMKCSEAVPDGDVKTGLTDSS